MMSDGKWSIAKRETAEWTGWPWLVTYPDGKACCRCFSFASAVQVIRESQRALRLSRSEFNRHLRRSAAGSFRSVGA